MLALFIGFLGLFAIPLYLILIGFIYYKLNVQYKKEKYTILPDKIIRNSGGIFSDNEVELVIRNITHVTMKLPFLENKLMKTGSISIQSAGSGAAEVRISSIANPEKFYDTIQDVMKKNGFKLTKSNSLQKEIPNALAVFFESSMKIFGGFVIFLVVGLSALVAVFSAIINTFGAAGVLALLVLVLLVAGILFTKFFLRFMDLKKRVYNVYDDVITYSEGFLSKNYSFIPIENLSDSELTQTLVDKIFGLYDVKISCQGSGQEILFKNIANGQEMENNIDRLINSAKSTIGTGRRSKSQYAASSMGKPVETADAKKTKVAHSNRLPEPDTEFQATYRMHFKKSMAPFWIALPFCIIIFPLLIPWAIGLIMQFIAVNSTEYVVKPKSVESRYNFLFQRNVEFSNEKITGIILTESFIDRWFGTCSISFWSIGASTNITFSNIIKTPGIYESITAKKGIRPQEPLYNMDSSFSFMKMLKANVFLNLFFLIMITGVVAFTGIINLYPSSRTPIILIDAGVIAFLMLFLLLYVLIFRLQSNYYKKSKFTFYTSYVHFEEGLDMFNRFLFKRHYYSDYDSIKDVATLKYPFLNSGKVTFNVAGEILVERNTKHGKQISIRSNKFGISYIDSIDVKNDLVDVIFYRRPKKAELLGIEQNIESHVEKQVIFAKPHLINSFIGIPLILMLIQLIPPLILFLPITLFITILMIKAKSYFIQPHRVVAKSGIIYKKQVSILFSRVDHINLDRGASNKLFGTGNISVNTAGSSRPEIVIRNIKEFKQFYDFLKQKY